MRPRDVGPWLGKPRISHQPKYPGAPMMGRGLFPALATVRHCPRLFERQPFGIPRLSVFFPYCSHAGDGDRALARDLGVQLNLEVRFEGPYDGPDSPLPFIHGILRKAMSTGETRPVPLTSPLDAASFDPA